MYLVRPVEHADIPALVSLAAQASQGVHTLPRSQPAIERAVDRSIASFSANVDIPGEESYYFVLESVTDRSIAGSATIAATAGSSGTFFAFRNDVIQQVSRDLNISHSVHALTLCSDLTGHSQLAGFYLHDRRCTRREAALLSRARLSFAALSPNRFADKFFASLAGMMDENMRSPFWEALGRKFFQMDFIEAERLIEGARNQALIVELMPHYPVYVPLLPGEAQAAMGQVHSEGELPFDILTDEGFEPDEFIDIFDGGPILRAPRKALRSFNASFVRRVVQKSPTGAESVPYLLSSTRQENFRAIVLDCVPLEDAESLHLPRAAMRCLNVSAGEPVSCVRL